VKSSQEARVPGGSQEDCSEPWAQGLERGEAA
jgi:hypothetical protein